MTDLMSRYRAVYQMPADAPIDAEMIHRHWRLERQLAQELLASEPAERWTVFDACYSRLYQELHWLNAYSDEGAAASTVWEHADWADLVGAASQRIYEVGSGSGSLITHLAALGHRCRASEITRERGAGLGGSHPNVKWVQSDGVHLDAFEQPASFDVVLSDQVLEHLHPEDLVTHLRAARAILVPGGRYLFATPHRFLGPADVSAVFEETEALGMHLKEYRFDEMCSALRAAGFTEVRAVLRLPNGMRARLPSVHPRKSRWYLRYLLLVERLLSWTRPVERRQRWARKARAVGFRSIFLEAHTPAATDAARS